MSKRAQSGWSRANAAKFAALAILLALRVFWVPVHLALEHHDAVHVGSSAFGQDDDQHHDHHEHAHGHENEHEHSDEQRHQHTPHPAADHATGMLVARVAKDHSLAPLALVDSLSMPAPLPVVCKPPADCEVVPRPPPPRSSRARAPPRELSA